MKFLLSLVFGLLLFSGCQSQPEPVKSSNSKPTWILNPNQNGKIGAIGIANRTYDQKISSQRKLSITRALDELTLQRGVKVELNMQKEETLKNDRATTDVNSQSSYNASATVTAHIEDVWMDNLSGELYIWMVID